MRAAEVTAPCRADLAGGTLDIWPLGMLHPGAVTVNVAIPVRVRLRVVASGRAGRVIHRVGAGPVRELGPDEAARDLTAAVAYHLVPHGGLEVTVLDQAPVGSGLGGSSAYAVALIRAVAEVAGLRLARREVVTLARDLEARVLSAPTGTQDHWAAVLGGTVALHLEPGGERVERLAADTAWLGERLTVFFTGIRHHSGMVNWEVIRRRLEGDPEVAAALEEIAAAAREVREALLVGDAERLAAGVRREWAARRRLAPAVCPPEFGGIVEAALAAGAEAVKACGAGGGGSLLLWHAPGRRGALRRALAEAAPGGRVLAAGADTVGLRVVPVP